MRFAAVMVSCTERDETREKTLVSWSATDWGAAPLVQMDRGRQLKVSARIEETWLEALRAAMACAEFAVLLEDDLEFNCFLRHNLERWPPLRAMAGGELPFFGSLYRTDQRLLWSNPPHRYVLPAPESFWGAQALVISRATCRYLLERWQPGGRAHDLKANRLAAELGPIYCHVPSLVQHRVGPSTWGGVIHQAHDFDGAFRAE